MRGRTHRLSSVAAACILILAAGCSDEREGIAVDTTRDIRAWAVGQYGVETGLLRSDDGGLHWEVIWTTPFGAEDDLSFESRAQGMLLIPGLVLATTDGGTSWTDVYVEPPRPVRAPSSLEGLAFAGTPGRYAVAGNPRDPHTGTSLGSYVLLTNDAGSTWNRVDSPALGPELGVLSLCFTRSGVGLLAGFTGEPQPESELRALVSADGGASWTYVPGAGTGFGRARFLLVLDVECAADDSLWILGEVGDTEADIRFVLMRSDDGGATWEDLSDRLPREDYLIFADVSFVDARRGLIAGTRLADQGRSSPALFRTRAGGERWEEVELPDGTLGVVKHAAGALSSGGEALWLTVGAQRIEGNPPSEIGFALRARERGAASSSELPDGISQLDDVAFASE